MVKTDSMSRGRRCLRFMQQRAESVCVSVCVCVCVWSWVFKEGCYQSVHRKFKQAVFIAALIDPSFHNTLWPVFVYVQSDHSYFISERTQHADY